MSVCTAIRVIGYLRQYVGTYKRRAFAATISLALLISAGCLAAQEDGSNKASGYAEIDGAHVIKASVSETEVRQTIRKSRPGEVLFIEPGSSWRLTKTLHIPEGVTIIGTHPGGGGQVAPTFIKGFDGPLVTLSRFTTLRGLYFDGNKAEFTGDGIVTVGHKRSGVREVIMERVEVRNNRGNGFVISVPYYYSECSFCTFDRNDGYGIVYDEVVSHHTDNMWRSVHVSYNGKGGVALHSMDQSSVWENSEFFHNGGAAFEQFDSNRNAGSYVITVRNTVIRNHAGPVWLQRALSSWGVVFEDCRLKHNGDPEESMITRGTGQTVERLLGLTGPVSGLFHVEKGRLFVELRGGFAWDNGEYIFTTSPGSDPGSRITVSGSGKNGGIGGGINAPHAYATILDTTLLPKDAEITVRGGIGLDPRTGQVKNYGNRD